MGLALLLLAAWQQPQTVQQLLLRVSEEAEVFRTLAPKMVGEETLVQRARKSPPRFRPRVGEAALRVPKPEFRSREIVSEYGFSTLKDSRSLHEFRQVVAVDGRQILSREKARETLSLGIRSQDDRAKKRMLEAFERNGLTGAATDFGQVLLLFTRRALPQYSFEMAGSRRIGAEAALVLRFRQQSGAGALLIFDRRKALHQPLEGELWVRASDGVPLRVLLRTSRKDGDKVIRDEAGVDYLMTQHGALAPAAVTHRQYTNDELVVENLFRYSAFHVFAADAQVKFTEDAPK